MKKMLFVLICLGLMIFGSCESPVNPSEGSTVEIKIVNDFLGEECTCYVENYMGAGFQVTAWQKTGPNEWKGNIYLDYSNGAGYHVFAVTLYGGWHKEARTFFARDRDKGQDWVELTNIQLDPNGEVARFDLGREKGVYF